MPNLGEAFIRPYQDADRVAADPAYGSVVCFCERVTEGEIRDACVSLLPPHSLEGLRGRTRVMNGRCQGFYCGARRIFERDRQRRHARCRRGPPVTPPHGRPGGLVMTRGTGDPGTVTIRLGCATERLTVPSRLRRARRGPSTGDGHGGRDAVEVTSPGVECGAGVLATGPDARSAG